MPESFDTDRVEQTLRDLLAAIPAGEPDTSGLNARRTKRLVDEIRAAIDRRSE